MKERKLKLFNGTEISGAEELRLAVSNIDHNSGTFNDRFTAKQLLQINRMLVSCKWDIMPDQWSERQVREALQGIVPRFSEAGRPVYQRKGVSKTTKTWLKKNKVRT